MFLRRSVLEAFFFVFRYASMRRADVCSSSAMLMCFFHALFAFMFFVFRFPGNRKPYRGKRAYRILKNRQRGTEMQTGNKIKEKLRPHELTLTLKILKILAKKPQNTLAIYRQLQNHRGFRNHHSFYRQLRFCIQNRLIELAETRRKWGIPTKIYRITPKGEQLLEVFKDEVQKIMFHT